MQADLKHKRKAAGFIRTNSSKALPTFKLPNKSSSSDDFSSFEDSPNRQAHPQQSDSQFSPYKNTVPAVQPYRPPVPPTYPESRSNLAQKQGVQVQSQVFSNQKLRRNYQTGNYLESPGKIVDRSNRNSRILRDREEQIRETLRKRVEVEKELAQIDKICQEIEHIKDPHQHSKEKYGKEVGGKPKSMEKYVSETSKVKPSFSQQKQQYKYKDQPVYELPRSPKQPLNSQNRNILNKQPQAPKPEKLPTQSYNLDQSEIHQNSSSQEGEQQYSAFQCEQTFKPNASEQILTSIQEYKKLHPEIEGNASNVRKGIRNRNSSQNQDRVRKEHQRARQRFILEQQNQVSVEKEEEISEDEDEEEGLIQEYPTQQFKKTTIKQTIEATRNLQGNSPTFGKTKPNNPNPPIENSSGIHKAKGGICFDLDINQFTQYESKPVQKQTVYVGRKGKKINTKEELLKRREIAKNYDKLARAKVFSGY